MAQYYVVGSDSPVARFRETVGGNEEWFGPFGDYESAEREWFKHAWQAVTTGKIRYRIECIDPDDPPPGTD